MSERLVRESDQIPINLLPSALSTIVDRASLLHGNPTAIIAHTRAPDALSPEDLQKMFDALPCAQATVIEEAKSLSQAPTNIKSLNMTPKTGESLKQES
jgi:hypothetical protein